MLLTQYLEQQLLAAATAGGTVGPATQLAITVSPGNGGAGTVLAPHPTVEVRDASGSLVTSATNAVTAALVTPGGATLGGTLTVNASGGVVTFSDLVINRPGTYQLIFSSAGLTGATSAVFNALTNSLLLAVGSMG